MLSVEELFVFPLVQKLTRSTSIKRAIILLTIIPIFLGGFFKRNFCTNGNVNDPSTIKLRIYNSTLTVSEIAAILSAVRDDRGRPLHAVRLIEPVVYNFRWKSTNVLLSNIA